MPDPLISNELFALNASINAHIHRILFKFSGQSQSRMLREIRQARKNCDAARPTNDNDKIDQADAQARHTFREFLVGEHLLDAGCTTIEYSPILDGKTPDWFDQKSSLIVEVFTNERDGTRNPQERLRLTIQKKAQKYKSIVDRRRLSFIIAIHPDFLGDADDADVVQTVRDGEIFINFPSLSGILVFSETTFHAGVQQYSFNYVMR